VKRSSKTQVMTHAGSAPIQGRVRRVLSAVFLALVLLTTIPATAIADEYDEDSAGHPLRIVAYVLHPVGVAIDYLILRPAHWLVSTEPMKTVFGHED